MINMPLISVIIPVFNSEKTIQETIKSVLKQSFTDFELIVINDGSQDASLEIITNIKDSRLKVLSYSNSGVSTSRNRGIYQWRWPACTGVCPSHADRSTRR